MSAQDLVNLTIDGIPVSVPKGTFSTISSPERPVFWLPMPGWPDLAKKCCW